ncbi:MAG: endonuclease domain-containing protein [Rhizobiales bacterium]|nr:endonuclease domain-containing protein [Hyphomicrobiales bacterium]
MTARVTFSSPGKGEVGAKRRVEAVANISRIIEKATPTPTLPLAGGGSSDDGAVTLTSPGKGEVGAKRRVGVTRLDRTCAKTRRARKLRVEQTPAETKLWSRLRNNAVHGVAFRRQHPIGNFVLDFYAPAVRLAVELDGSQHNEDRHQVRDKARSLWLSRKGIRTLRFWNLDVVKDIETVLDTIWHAIEATPTPTLPLAGGGSADDGAVTLTFPGKGEVGAKRRVGVTRLDRESNP